MIHPLLRRLQSGPLLADGAMGTQLYARGATRQPCFEELNLTNPGLVQAVHRDYLAAGAEIVESNTFGANRYRLAAYGLADQVRAINLRGVKIAREAREIAGETVYVAGAVGPLGLRAPAEGARERAEHVAAFREQTEALLEGGADFILLETFVRLDELLDALAGVRAACDLPVFAQMTVDEDASVLDGTPLAEVARALADAGADGVGVNCGVGPQSALEAVATLRRAVRLPVSAMPNAGLPRRVGGRLLYTSTPEYFADYAGRLVAAGASIVGGCCGTTPEHVRAMRAALGERPATAAAAERPPVVRVRTPEPSGETAAATGPTGLARLFAAGKFVVSVELDPPRGVNPAKMLAGAAALKQVGVDLFNIADSPMARVRMSCLAAAELVRAHTGLEAIIHFTTRDRNLMALQSELIGAHALGIRNVLALTGDPPRLGDYPSATGVWDVDSVGLIGILKRLNEGRDLAGTSIGRRASFFVGAAVNPTADDLGRELEHFGKKIDAGADFIMSQPLYDLETLERFLDRAGNLKIPLVLGVMPVQSFKHAEFLHNEVPGILIPSALLERMRLAGERGIAEGIAQAQEFLSQAKRYVQGTYLMPSFGRYEIVGELIKALA